MEILYIGRNRKNIWKATRKKGLAESKFVNECFPAVFPENIHGDKVYIARTYYGHELDPMTGNKTSRFVTEHCAYATVTELKENSAMWAQAEDAFKEDPQRFVRDHHIISTNDGKGNYYRRGDFGDGNFCTQILGIKIV